MPADLPAHRHVVIGDPRRRVPSRRGASVGRQRPQFRRDRVQCPGEVDRCRPGGEQQSMRGIQRAIGRIVLHRQRQPVGPGDADQRRAAHHHRADAVGGIPCGPPLYDFEGVGQLGLVYDPLPASPAGQIVR